MPFMGNKEFRKKYQKIFKKDPLAANIFLLLCELSGPEGKLLLPLDRAAIDKEIESLLFSRFEDPWGWQI
jgi:hypothetical protein